MHPGKKNASTRIAKTVAAACTVAALLTPSTSNADGKLTGRVTDQSGEFFFEGALITIHELNLETVSSGGGRFTFNSVPAGDYKMEVSYLGAKPVLNTVRIKDEQTTNHTIKIGKESDVIENVIVYGQGAAVNKAINQMRAADNITSVVTSDFVGQFPDENVSEALQRVAGVFIERDQGEGRFVGVRGISPGLNVSQINGLAIPAPENSTRAVALDVLPSDLVESLEVTKTLTPDMSADSIGGTINVKSLNAFDRSGMYYRFKTEARYNDLEEETEYKYSGAFTNVFQLGEGELGVALSYSNGEKTIGTDNIEVDGGWDNDFEDSGIRAAEEVEMRNYEVTREREGIALNLDYHANDSANYYLRSLYSKFSDQEFRNRIEFKLDEGDISELTETSHVRTDTELQRELKDRFEEQEILSIQIGGENRIDDWKIEYSYGYSEAQEEEPGRIDSQFENGGVSSAGYTSLGETPTLVMSADAMDASTFELDEIVVENNFTDDEKSVFKLDLTRDISIGGNPGYIKFGARYSTREKTNDLDLAVYDGFAGDPTLAQFVNGSTDFTLGNYGPYIDYRLQRDFVLGAVSGVSECAVGTYDENLCSFELDEDESILGSARDYVIEEDIFAAYLMSRVDVGAWRFVYGLRYEDTAFSAQGFQASEVDVPGEDDVQIVANSFDNDYDNLFPGINLRYKHSDELIIRAAYTESISRPSFGNLNPSPDEIVIEEDGTDIVLEVEAGNPLLEPYESRNLDFSVEYYPGDIGILSAGVFYKQIENFIFNADVSSIADPADYAGSIAVTDAEIFMPLNGEDADLHGLELSWTRQFSELPEPFDGLLMIANATFTDSEADLGLPDGAERSNDSKLTNQADTVANFVIGYEKYGLSLRLSTAFIDERIAEINLEDATNDLYEDTHNQVDFTARYDINDQFQVFFNAININEEPNYRYFGNGRYNAQYDEVGSSYVLGFSYRN